MPRKTKGERLLAKLNQLEAAESGVTRQRPRPPIRHSLKRTSTRRELPVAMGVPVSAGSDWIKAALIAQRKAEQANAKEHARLHGNLSKYGSPVHVTIKRKRVELGRYCPFCTDGDTALTALIELAIKETQGK